MPLNVDKLNELLVEKNLNYSELAKKANISKNQISRIVNKDKPRVQLKTISALSKALNVSYKELYISDNKE
ncbi:helix-turn-helix domain-containing protein [Clostridium butyricum]|uniref:helix-turn-helix domain-containing protein n=1 Tax=Clostridium butyricum TaxID=1492 RepID=UPI00205E11FF|nr:helix-turn-helix transcriptional regulator [Clostridium butyricum]MDU1339402.1 helix-turn-helix transcriptional regulator [Clostridium butyricum]DAQ80549.1 MAG TPA: Cro/C1-type HTH DNA-binding domain protein [Inoviridae sp.]